ncbi:MAG: glycerol kinase GlpK [Myxococcales bacterium]|jgi:glycerol kinase|nr:glycerol kinase GlpK [Myxococcales bacterium]
MPDKLLLAIDQGTTGSTALVVTLTGETRGRATVDFPQHFPKPGWVEHDAKEIWSSVEAAVKGALAKAGVRGEDVAAIGITNQRETTLVWDRKTHEPIHRAIVWQCRRTADTCKQLEADGVSPRVRDKTGLVLDAYFSGTKVAWILDAVDGARARADRGELAFGTIDCFLVHRLTGGDVHATDVTNASRTLLMDLRSLAWDDELLRIFRVPASVLPKIVGSAEVVAHTRGVGFLPDGIPIAGIAGDQQAALFGQACFDEGDAKCTYGTGAFALANIGKRVVLSERGLVTTVAWKVGGETTYALEGSAFIAGAAVQWLRDGLGIIQSASEVEALASQVSSSEGVTFVPALAGLGAPYWDPNARGTIGGLTRGSTRAHVARATLEGIAFSVLDLLGAMAADAGRPLTKLRVDGGACANGLLMQTQADLANVIVERPTEIESTGRGAAMLAGLGAGLSDIGAVRRMWKHDRSFSPTIGEAERAQRTAAWRRAVAAARLA